MEGVGASSANVGHDNGEPVDESPLEEIARRLANEFSTRSDDLKDLTTHGLLIAQVSQITELIKKFDAGHQDNPTFCYWRKYMNLVSILLRFTRALARVIGNSIFLHLLICFHGLPPMIT